MCDDGIAQQRIHGFHAMRSSCSFRFHLDSAWEAEIVAGLAMDEVRRIEAKYSAHSPDSYLAYINECAMKGQDVELDPESVSLMRFAFMCFQRSGGLFDITAGVLRRAYDFKGHRRRTDVDIEPLLEMTGLDKLGWIPPKLNFTVPGVQLDLGGIAKEYAVDCAATIFRENGVRHGLIDLGGDMAAIGPPPNSSAWTVGVRDPRVDGELLATILLAEGAIATSGDYENYIEVDGERLGHIINPETGLPTRGLASVTVPAGTCMAAGAVTTIAMLYGAEGVDWLKDRDIPFCALTSEGELVTKLPDGVFRPGQL